MTQEEWIEKQREKRNPEFAPPTSQTQKHPPTNKQNPTFQPSASSAETSKSSTMEKHVNKSFQNYRKNFYCRQNESSHQIDRVEERNMEFAPPATFQYNTPNPNQNKKNINKFTSHSNMEEAVAAGISAIRRKMEESNK